MTHDHDHEHGHDHDHDHDGHDHDHAERHFYGVIPVFLVDDVMTTAEYYRDTLGFDVEFIYGEPPAYSSVSRDDAIINLTRSDPPGRRNGIAGAAPGNGSDVYIVVSDIDDVYEELKARGAYILQEPESYDYGMREFKVQDLNGYQLLFGEDTGDDDDDDEDEDEDDDT